MREINTQSFPELCLRATICQETVCGDTRASQHRLMPERIYLYGRAYGAGLECGIEGIRDSFIKQMHLPYLDVSQSAGVRCPLQLIPMRNRRDQLCLDHRKKGHRPAGVLSPHVSTPHLRLLLWGGCQAGKRSACQPVVRPGELHQHRPHGLGQALALRPSSC